MRKPNVVPLVTFIFFVLASIVLTGCPRPVTTTTTTSGATTTASAPTSTTTKKEIAVTLYFIKDFQETSFLVPERRSIPETESVARATLEELIKGPQQPGLARVIPAKTKVRSIKIANNLATVDLSRDVLEANVGSEGEALGIAQIVNTLTEFPTIKRVMFLVEGRDRGTIDGREIQDWWGHVGLSEQPFSRNVGLIQGGKVSSNTITVNSPRAFTTVSSPLTVEGTATVFEAQFNVRITDIDGTVLAQESILASNFLNGTFNEKVSFKKPKTPGRGTVLFYFNSPRDGSEVKMASVTVFLK
ncbi:MAG: GerMN domain-containing protein [Candidatus Aquicultor sp.]